MRASLQMEQLKLTKIFAQQKLEERRSMAIAQEQEDE